MIQEWYDQREYEKVLNHFGSLSLHEMSLEDLSLVMKTLVQVGQFDELHAMEAEVIELVETIDPILKLDFYHHFLIAYYRLGKYDQGLEFLETTREIHSLTDHDTLDHDQKKTYASFYNHAGVLNYAKNNIDLALKNYTRLKQLGERDNLATVSIVAAINIAVIYDLKWEYNKSIENYEFALKLANEIDSDRYRLTLNNNLSYIYNSFGELDKAKKVIDKAYQLAIELKDRVLLSKILTNRGEIHSKLGKLSQAEQDFLESYEIKEEVGNDYECIITLFYLIETYLFIGDRVEAVKYLRVMRSHAENLSAPSPHYTLAAAIFLKGSALTRHRYKAEQMLREIIEAPDTAVQVQNRLQAILHLLKLLVTQVDEETETEQLIDEEREEIEEDLLTLYHRILEIQDRVESPLIQLQIHHIRAYLHLFFLQPELVEEELEKAQKIFRETGVKTVEFQGPDPSLLNKFRTISPSLHHSLNSLIHVEPRLKILIALMDNTKLVFRELQNIVGLTPGNLGRHADKLVDAGYVDKRKEIVDDKFLTVYSITPEGLNEFDRYKEVLRSHLR